VSDPVQADTYAQRATVGELARDMWLSNYVTPRWFDPAAVGRVRPHGHAVGAADDVGRRLPDRAERSGDVERIRQDAPGRHAARMNVAAKVMRPGSRTLRRLRG
jgi:hypothetical protein